MYTGLKNYISHFLTAPQKLFWVYILLNIVPSIFLLFSEPFNTWGKIVLFFFPLGVYLILFSLSKNTGLIQILLFPLLIIHAFQLVLFYLFGEDVISVDMFLNVVTTNSSEAGELLKCIWPSIIFVCILYIPVMIISVKQFRKKIYLDSEFRKKMVVVGTGLIMGSYILSYPAINKNTGLFSFHKDVYPVDVFYNLNFAVVKWYRSNLYTITSADFTFDARKDSMTDKREIYVLVIGETSRAESWSLYGYHRRTNPKLGGKEGLLFFDDAITQSNTTHKSVSIMLSPAAAENYDDIYHQKSIIDAFKEVGFTTVFLSNQSGNHTFTQFFAERADYYRNIRSGEKGYKISDNYDEVLLPILKNCIDSIPGNIFAVVHTYGSHFNYRERYPQKYTVYKPDDVTEINRKDKDKLVNAYDNSILYTDNFLFQITGILEDTGACSSLMFASDHGEDIMDDGRMRFLHASPNPTFYQLRIPMFIWFSPEYISSVPEKVEAAYANKPKPVTTNTIFHTLLDMASVKTCYLQENLSLVSPAFRISKRMYLDDHDEPIHYYKANLKKEDKMMIEKRRMYH